MVFGYSLMIIPHIYLKGLEHEYSFFSIEAGYQDIMEQRKLPKLFFGSFFENLKKFAVPMRRNYAVT